MKKIVAALLVCLASMWGCSNDSQSDYLGVWQSAGNPPKTIEISKDGDNYVFHDLRATHFNGKRDGPRPLSKQDSQLMLNNGMSNMPLGLSADKNTLLLAGVTLTRVAKGEDQKLKQEIEAQFAQRQADRVTCEGLGREMAQKEKDINQSNATASVKYTSSKALKADITARATTDCKRILMLY